MEGWHHLKWHQIRKKGSPDRRRRRDRLHSLEIVIRIDPTSTAFIDLLDRCLMRKPPFMEMTRGSPIPSKVVIVLPTNSSHGLLEVCQLVLEVLHRIVQDVQSSRLLANYLPEI